MSSQGNSSGRRRITAARQTSVEDQALNHIAREAEARLAARRAARAEARNIRMHELEKQAKESEEKQDRHFELVGSNRSARPGGGSESGRMTRLGSEDSNEDSREVKKELVELEEKYKKAMMNNAQLDNEKQTYRYQVDLQKDQIEELEEALLESQREHRDRCRDLEQLRRDHKDLNFENKCLKEQLDQRDKLIKEYGLVFINNESVEGDGKKPRRRRKGKQGKQEEEEEPVSAGNAALVTPDALAILSKQDGNLDEKLKLLDARQAELEEEVKRLRQQLEEEREKTALSEKFASPKHEAPRVNGPDMQIVEMQMDHQKEVSEYKFKLKKADQDITQLEGNVIRLESQVKRYRAAAEASEKNEEDLKQEKRKTQRELRDAQNEVEELQTQNQHLVKRLEKLRSARNALAKP